MSNPYRSQSSSANEPSGIVGTSGFGQPGYGQPVWGQQGYGAMVPRGPMPAPQQGASLLVHMRNGLQASNGASVRPRLVIDGVNAPVEWGTNRVSVAPGRHQVQAGVASLGGLTAPVDVNVGQGLEQQLHFAGPALFGGAGRLGLTPQKSPGLNPWIFMAIAMVVPMAVMLLMMMAVFAMG